MSAAPLVFRWAARLLSLAIIAFIVLSALTPGGPPTRAQLVGLFFFPGLLVLGHVIAWWREFAGAIVATVGLAGFYVWSDYVGTGMARGPWFVVGWSPAALFACSAFLRGRANGARGRA